MHASAASISAVEAQSENVPAERFGLQEVAGAEIKFRRARPRTTRRLLGPRRRFVAVRSRDSKQMESAAARHGTYLNDANVKQTFGDTRLRQSRLALAFSRDRRVRKAQDRRPSHADHPPDPVEAKSVGTAEKPSTPSNRSRRRQHQAEPSRSIRTPACLVARCARAPIHRSKDDGSDYLKHECSSPDQ